MCTPFIASSWYVKRNIPSPNVLGKFPKEIFCEWIPLYAQLATQADILSFENIDNLSVNYKENMN